MSSGNEESVQFQDILLRESRNLNKTRQWCQSSCSNNQTFTDQHEFTFDEAKDSSKNQEQELSNHCRGSFVGKYDLSENCLMHSVNEDEVLTQQDQSLAQDYHKTESINEASQLRDHSSRIASQKYKGRKTKEQMKILISYYHLYEGSWDDENFFELVQQTGFSKKQLNKWFWDRKKKETDALEAKKLSYPGLIFAITNVKTGQDLTPEFKKICSKPIF